MGSFIQRGRQSGRLRIDRRDLQRARLDGCFLGLHHLQLAGWHQLGIEGDPVATGFHQAEWAVVLAGGAASLHVSNRAVQDGAE